MRPGYRRDGFRSLGIETLAFRILWKISLDIVKLDLEIQLRFSSFSLQFHRGAVIATTFLSARVTKGTHLAVCALSVSKDTFRADFKIIISAILGHKFRKLGSLSNSCLSVSLSNLDQRSCFLETGGFPVSMEETNLKVVKAKDSSRVKRTVDRASKLLCQFNQNDDCPKPICLENDSFDSDAVFAFDEAQTVAAVRNN